MWLVPAAWATAALGAALGEERRWGWGERVSGVCRFLRPAAQACGVQVTLHNTQWHIVLALLLASRAIGASGAPGAAGRSMLGREAQPPRSFPMPFDSLGVWFRGAHAGAAFQSTRGPVTVPSGWVGRSVTLSPRSADRVRRGGRGARGER